MAFGDIGAELGKVQFETEDIGLFSNPVHVFGRIHAIAYPRTTGVSRGLIIKTFNFSTDGITLATVNELNIDVTLTSGNASQMLQLAPNIWIVMYLKDGGASTGWYVATVRISDDGNTITLLDSYRFDSNAAGNSSYYGGMCRLNLSDYYAFVYAGSGDDGYIRTIEIASDGTITHATTDWWEYDSSDGKWAQIHHITGIIYAISYTDGTTAYIKTLNVADDGTITNAFIDTQAVGNSQIAGPRLVRVSGNYWAVFLADAFQDGWMYTYEISDLGAISATVDFWEFDGVNGVNCYPITASDNEAIDGKVMLYAHAQPNGTHESLRTNQISNTGTITKSMIDEVVLEAAGQISFPTLMMISGSYYIYAIFYRRPGVGGYVVSRYVAGPPWGIGPTAKLGGNIGIPLGGLLNS